MKILLLEDEVMLNESICEYLDSVGHQVESFFNGLDGLSFLEKIHDLKIHVPVVYISALVDIEDISRAYDLGCYDYLKKPFHLKELSLRVDRVKLSSDIPRIHLRLSKNYSYDQEHSTLLFSNEPQVLTKRQSQIIDLLSRNRGMVVDFEQFRIYVWDENNIDNATIRAEINRLKKSLKEDFIINVRGMGYMVDKP